MKTARKPYPSDVSEEEWALVAPYPTLLPEEGACKHGIKLAVVKLPEVKRGFVLLPWRWLAERTFAWTTRFRRLAQDCERLPQTLADLHVVALVCLELRQAVNHAAIDNSFQVGNNDLIRSFLDQSIPH